LSKLALPDAAPAAGRSSSAVRLPCTSPESGSITSTATGSRASAAPLRLRTVYVAATDEPHDGERSASASVPASAVAPFVSVNSVSALAATAPSRTTSACTRYEPAAAPPLGQ